MRQTWEVRGPGCCDVADSASTVAAQRAGCGQRRVASRGGGVDRTHRKAHDMAVSDVQSLLKHAPVRHDRGMQKGGTGYDGQGIVDHAASSQGRREDMEISSGVERRRHPRFSEPFPARVCSVDTSGQACASDTALDNFSAGGLYVRFR
jgi:hypothetical protein